MLRPGTFYQAGFYIECTFKMLHQVARLTEQKTYDLFKFQLLDLLCIIPDMLTVPVVTDWYSRAVHTLPDRG